MILFAKSLQSIKVNQKTTYQVNQITSTDAIKKEIIFVNKNQTTLIYVIENKITFVDKNRDDEYFMLMKQF
jgi:hypothetical protein